jgi:tRNA(Arg) A34 adenosine deaminase TadA
MNSIYPGVRAGQSRVANDLVEAARWAQQGALRASERGTFCVGGVLLGPGLQLLAESSNCVLYQGLVCDPTAHGERQLVDWYFDHQKDLPPARECTVVSTLDPCMMCTGALLYAGFRVVSLALDPDAGVNWAGDQKFESLPPALRVLALQRFAYLGVEGVRPPFGCAEMAPAQLERESYALFRKSLERVQALVYGRRMPPARTTTWRDEPAALFDADDQVVGVAGNGPHTRTAVMDLARRFALKDLTLVQRTGPDLGPLSIMELGAYGSCVEGPLPSSPRARWQYRQPGCPEADLQAQLARMPRHYRQVVGIRIEPES